MRKKIILSCLLVMSCTLYGQTPPGRYFQNIENTIWITNNVIDTNSVSLKNDFYLSILETEIDSINSNSILIKIGEHFKVIRYNASTKDQEIIFECTYDNNEEWHIFTLIIGDKEFKYLYVPTSTGGMINFNEMRK